MNRSLFTGLPFFPELFLDVSVHISFTFSRTILQCLSKAFTRASNFRLLRHEIKTWVWERTAVWRIERGPEVNSCSSRTEISYSLQEWNVSQPTQGQSIAIDGSVIEVKNQIRTTRAAGDVEDRRVTHVRSDRGLFKSSL